MLIWVVRGDSDLKKTHVFERNSNDLQSVVNLIDKPYW